MITGHVQDQIVAGGAQGEILAAVVDDMIRTYTRETVATRREGASDSTRPVFDTQLT